MHFLERMQQLTNFQLAIELSNEKLNENEI